MLPLIALLENEAVNYYYVLLWNFNTSQLFLKIKGTGKPSWIR